MVSKNYYHPLDAAILWSNLQEHCSQIMSTAFHTPEKLVTLFPQWPLLHIYAERIYDAVARGELAASYLGQPITSLNEDAKPYITIRHSDFRIWVDKFYPDDRPKFLSNSIDKDSSCIPLATYLIQKTKLDAVTSELESLRHQLLQLEHQLSVYRKPQEQPVSHSIDGNKSQEAGISILYTIIGALLHVTVGNSKNGKVQSIYKAQTAIVDTITINFPNTPGLSKRTLDRKFAEARRHLAQAIST